MTDITPIAPHAFPAITAAMLQRLSRAVDAWVQEGAVFVPLPWAADPVFVAATRPSDRCAEHEVNTCFGQLVASGEQSFCHVAALGLLPDDATTYVGWTPCWRAEPVLDQWHHYAFAKAEVFAWCQTELLLNETIDCAHRLFTQWLSQDTQQLCRPQCIQTSADSWDIEWQGIELGSYGIRHHPTLGCRYVYGTALAEPRYGNAIAGFQMQR